MAPENTPSQTGESATPAGTVSIPLVEGEGLQPIYANFVKVSSAPEEIVLDFGLNLNLPGSPATAIKLSQRLVMNYYTAKRLWATLAQSLQRHEQTFGVLETDIGKRVIPSAQRPPR